MVDRIIPLGSPETWEIHVNAPFHDWNGLTHFLRQVRRKNDDAMLLLDGLEGSGKSTIAFQLARALKPDWDPEKHLIIDFEDWEAVYSLEPGQVFVLDEGGDLMFSRDAMKGENKLLIRMFQMARIFNHVIIVCAPNIHWLDVYVREHRGLIYIHAHKEFTSEGAERGLLSVHWPKRWFDWKEGEWKNQWNRIFYARFEPIPQDLPVWIRYEARKRMKVQMRQLELQEQLSR